MFLYFEAPKGRSRIALAIWSFMDWVCILHRFLAQRSVVGLVVRSMSSIVRRLR